MSVKGAGNYKKVLMEGLTCGRMIKDCSYPYCECHEKEPKNRKKKVDKSQLKLPIKTL